MRTLGYLIRALRESGQNLSWHGKDTKPVVRVTADSRLIRPGAVFVALQGEKADGHAFVNEALAGGCSAVVVEKDVTGPDRDTVIKVEDSRRAYGILSAAFHGWPAREMTLIGLTGTNGKTTTAWIIENMLRAAGRKTGVLGTVSYRYAASGEKSVEIPAPLTTPEPGQLHKLLRQMRDNGVTNVVMEVSSHALEQQRLAGMLFDLAVFTNLSRDHLDYHQSMERYFAAKRKLFVEYLKPDGKAVVIVDDQASADSENPVNWGRRLVEDIRVKSMGGNAGSTASATPLIICGLEKDCKVRAERIEQNINGFSADFFLGDQEISLHSGLIGRHNVMNMLAAAGVGQGLGLKASVIKQGLEQVEQVPGRLERIGLPEADSARKMTAVFVDYAHTPDALENVLHTLRPSTKRFLYCVFGCGGDRDRGKRSLMGLLAGRIADRVILTSDNPRTEDPQSILREVERGLRKSGARRVDSSALFGSHSGDKIYTVIEDRRQAIHTACNAADEEDVVLIAGKGHETYQITAAGKRFFDDRIEARNSQLRWTPSRLAAASGGTLLHPGKTSLLGEVSTDTRTLKPGDIFLALQGENFDGHDFCPTALEKGAAALIVSRTDQLTESGTCIIRVPDTLKALGDLASFRRRLLAPDLRVIGITGSSGKTTVKEMTAAILTQGDQMPESTSVLKTAGNLNNLIGLPLTLLQVHSGHRTAVLEMGMNRPGEIAELTRIAQPDIGCITNVQAAHLEGLGSIQGVARAKGELFAGMSDRAIRVVNFDDPRTRKLGGRYGDNVIGFAVTPAGRRIHPAVKATRVVNLGESGMRFTLHIDNWQKRLTVPATGLHNVANCAAAAAIATAAGVDPESIVRGLQCYRSGDKRLQIVELAGGLRVLNDSYNANPSSMAAALKTVSHFGSACRRMAVLGDMLELGEAAAAAHGKIGALVAELGFTYLAVTGDFRDVVAKAAFEAGMPKKRIIACSTKVEIGRRIDDLAQKGKIGQGDWLLLKGSRGMRMELVLAELERLRNHNRN